ncbi:DNA mismatch repair endonuclease MutL [Lachnospira pectinoschiza]|uniref:DNA mismatch repair protein MutL n=1 Tax=Lachnospira pectinoschiza TaxID=28052 RepID=A0A1G9VDZ4_9FIRM|nr:DNA mismatch repair endonuclease MutL [Lachnospira pectinoschiza]SDM70442.1 DNA mismatch repair protein MutL [Lachnospira pectinoschiza]
MPIKMLDQATINKIAAGEVVDRPQSIVKELVENAIDAGASAITVEIKEGGISFIRVTDNGSGINGDEIPTAFLRHATSKIKSIEDLISVSSLGFRGEALASIAAVAQVELITKTKDKLNGYRYVIEGGKEKSLEEVGAPDGTTIVVRNLFYNTPVRRKFLKSANTEGGYINSLMQYLALSHPDVSFRFIANNNNKLHTSGNTNLKDIIYSVYGREITANLYEINAKTMDISMKGFICKPFICRGNRSYENYYINGRYIKSNIINKAIEDAYKGFVMPKNYPFTAIHFTINSEIIDVNVHPSKMELRFANNDYVYNFVYASVLSCLKDQELAANVSVGPNSEKEERTVAQPSLTAQATNPTDRRPEPASLNQHDKKDTEVKFGMASYNGLSSQNSAPKYQERRIDKVSAAEIENQVKPNINKERLPEPFEIKRSNEMIKEDLKEYEAVNDKLKTSEQMSIFDDKLLAQTNKPKYRIIGQLFETYWLFELGDKFYMMDQHAAHEKVLYERFMKHLHEKEMSSQMIMPPVILTLNMREEELLKENMKRFKDLGYEIEEFGGNEYKLTGIPAGLPTLDYKALFIEILDNLTEDYKSGEAEIFTDRVATMSCKAAVKGNNKLSINEVEELMQELMTLDNPYNCPHGRPTLIIMTKYDIERKFKRIVG